MNAEIKVFSVVITIIGLLVLLALYGGTARVMLQTEYEREVLFGRTIKVNGTLLSCEVVGVDDEHQ